MDLVHALTCGEKHGAHQILLHVDIVPSVRDGLAILTLCIALSVSAKAGGHSVAHALGHYDKSLSKRGNFTFFIGLLPAAS